MSSSALSGVLNPSMVDALVMLVVTLLGLLGSVCEAKCEFQAIFNFGDSNSDTGGFWAAFPMEPGGPEGMTYFKKRSGRASDGRLVIDFLAQAFGFPFLSPYLQSIGPNYTHGVNFATRGSTVLFPTTSLFVTGFSPFSLAIQLNQLKAFKATVDKLGGSDTLPSPTVFGESLYTFNIGQNDFTDSLTPDKISAWVQQYLPQVIARIVAAIKEIYDNIGGRSFLVFNLGPVGCYPTIIVLAPHHTSDLDEYGCLMFFDSAVAKYNKMLKEALTQTQKELPEASIICADTHSVHLELYRHPKDNGFLYGPKACCGYGGGTYNYDPRAFCGNQIAFLGSKSKAEACEDLNNYVNCDGVHASKATTCEDPYNYVSWDGVHATEATNKFITSTILSGSYLDPPFQLVEHCDINSIDNV